MTIKQRIVNSWYPNTPQARLGKSAGFVLGFFKPLSFLVERITKFKHNKFKINSVKQVRTPVIVVGNITVGGTGKSPLVLSLIDALRAAGFRPGVVSRGYGGQAPIYPFFVTESSDAKESGDEPLMLVKRTGVPCVVDPDRVQAVKLLLKKSDCNIVLSDDGLQHHGLYRDVEIVVLDGQRLLGNEQCLPVGPLRESISRLQDADYIVLNGDVVESGRKYKFNNAVKMYFQHNGIVSLVDGSVQSVGEFIAEHLQIHALAGIGNPDRFFTMLEGLGFHIERHPFDDHYLFAQQDINFSSGSPVLMTEKDAVKCQHLKTPNHYYLRVSAQLPEAFFEDLIKRIQEIS